MRSIQASLTSRAWRFLLLEALLVVWGLVLACVPAYGQSGDQDWSEPVLLFESTGRANTTRMLADRTGVVHVFLENNPNPAGALNFAMDDTMVFYTRREAGAWSRPVDILLYPDAYLPFGVVVDDKGQIHVFSQAPACLSYVSAVAQTADSARGWLKHKCMDEMWIDVPAAALDSLGNIYVAYAVPPNDWQIALNRSSDGGVSWSGRSEVAVAARTDVGVAFPALATDSKGRLHAVWTEISLPTGYPMLSLLYAYSTDKGQSWSAPIELAEGHQGDPNIAAFEDAVHVVWNGDASLRGRYYRSSEDGGLTWSPVQQLLPTGGLQRPPAIVVDSTGAVHILVASDSAAYYFVKDRSGWSKPVVLADFSQVGGLRGGEVTSPQLTISKGNLLFALYSKDANSVFVRSTKLDVPGQAPQPWSTITPSATQVIMQPTRHPTASPTALVVGDFVGSPSPPSRDSSTSTLLIGISSSIFVVVAVVTIVLLQRRKQ